MTVVKCPKCGKEYKKVGKYYNEHVESCTGIPTKPKAEKKGKIKREIKINDKIVERIENIEKRIEFLEKNYHNLTFSNKNKSEIKDYENLLEIIHQKIPTLSKRMLGIQKVLLRDLYNEINRDYYISIENFTSYLLKLYNSNKIQLEPGSDTESFFIKDNYGNIFKIIRILN